MGYEPFSLNDRKDVAEEATSFARQSTQRFLPKFWGKKESLFSFFSPKKEKAKKKVAPLWGILLGCLLFLLLFFSLAGGSLLLLFGAGAAATASSLPASSQELLQAEQYYRQKEAELSAQVQNAKEEISSLDVVEMQTDTISHDPTILLSYLLSHFPETWEESSTKSTMDQLFDKQYTWETKTWTEQESFEEPYRVRIRVTDPITGEVSYTTVTRYRTVTREISHGSLTLENHNLSAVVSSFLTASEQSRYLNYLSSQSLWRSLLS